MKALVVILVIATLAAAVLRYRRTKELKKLLVTLGLFAVVISLGFAGNIVRAIMPLFLIHIVLILFAWGALLYYILRDRLYLWAIFSPLTTIILFLVMEQLVGSAH